MANEAMIPVSDTGFRHGLGVFETLKVRNGVALFEEYHRENLIHAAQRLELPVDGLAYLPKTRPGDGIWRWFLTAAGVNTWFEEGVEVIPETYRMDLSPLRVCSRAWDARYKTLSYLLHYQARRQSSCDETLLLNENNEIASASMANIFWVKGNTLYTPDDSCGCRMGVVRRWILEHWPDEMLMGRWGAAELDDASEIFVTNSRVGIMPVVAWRERELPVGARTRTLQEAYQDAVERQAARMVA